MVTVVAVALFIFFSVATEHFLAADNLLNILRNLSFVGIVAVGMTYVFIAGELDLSVGSVFGFLTVLMGFLVARNGFHPWIGMVAVVAGGLAIGAMYGAITMGLNIPSFIVTLGSLTAFRSLALILSGRTPQRQKGLDCFTTSQAATLGGSSRGSSSGWRRSC